MFDNIIHSTIGLFHTICAVIAMITGVVVVLKPKGTKFHKRIGYVYVVSMLLLNVSSFYIMNFGGYTLFHIFAIISLIVVLVGLLTLKLKVKHWIYYHYYFMSWSVVGLYCAFWAEVGTRFVKNIEEFWWVVALAAFITSLIGGIIIIKEAKKLEIKE